MKKIYMIGKPLQECRYEREVSLVDVLIRGGGGHGNPLHYSCLENPMDRGTWWAIVCCCCCCCVASVVSNSVWPHRWQPTSLPRPWDSPGKNTGVGCHFLLQCMKVKSESEVAQSCLTGVGCHFLLQCMKVKSESEVAQSCLTLSDPHGLQPTRLLHPWDLPGKSTGVGCHCLLWDYSL